MPSPSEQDPPKSELLKGTRGDWILATKVGNHMSERPNESHYSRRWVLGECEQSLGE